MFTENGTLNSIWPLKRIWDYDRILFWKISISFLFVLLSLISSHLFNGHLISVALLILGTFWYLKVYFIVPEHIISSGRGLFVYSSYVIVFILCFQNIYIEHGIHLNKNVSHSFADTLYFSIVTWTTLGYGDFQPTESSRMWAATQALIGYTYMGILVGFIFYALPPKKSV